MKLYFNNRWKINRYSIGDINWTFSLCGLDYSSWSGFTNKLGLIILNFEIGFEWNKK